MIAQPAPIAPYEHALSMQIFAAPHRQRFERVVTLEMQLMPGAQQTETFRIIAHKKQLLREVLLGRQVL